MDIHINDILVMKKPHPCGENGGWCCAPERISGFGAWAAATR